MRLLRSFCRNVKFALLVLMFWAAAISSALADKSPDTPQEGGFTDYTVAYFLVMMGILVGLLVLLRSSSRRDSEGPLQYVEKNVMKEG